MSAFGVKQTLPQRAEMSAPDPFRTSGCRGRDASRLKDNVPQCNMLSIAKSASTLQVGVHE